MCRCVYLLADKKKKVDPKNFSANTFKICNDDLVHFYDARHNFCTQNTFPDLSYNVLNCLSEFDVDTTAYKNWTVTRSRNGPYR